MPPTSRRRPTNIKKARGGYSAHKAALGGRTKKTGQSRWFIGYKKHTLRLWMAHYTESTMLVPLMTWAAPANRGEALFLWPQLAPLRATSAVVTEVGRRRHGLH